MDEEDKRAPWARFEFASVVALASTLICLFVGQAAEQYASNVTIPSTSTASSQPRFNAIDYATTASIKGATVIIGPCDTRNR